ncbi:MAG: SEC-C metal-binding domain-containing protein, partial [Candidatus Xenobia bacterium]
WKDISSRGENDEDAGLIQLNLGNVALLAKRLDDAEKHLGEALRRFEKDTRGRLIEIVVLPNEKYHEQGFDPLLLADDALKVAVVRLNIATLRLLQGKPDAALQEARQALDLDSTLAYGHAALGWIHLARNEQDEAGAAFRKAQGKVPNDPQLKKILEQINPWFAARAGRNDPCPCGSGKKFKKCHGA